jgi:hypothetical protein
LALGRILELQLLVSKVWLGLQVLLEHCLAAG